MDTGEKGLYSIMTRRLVWLIGIIVIGVGGIIFSYSVIHKSDQDQVQFSSCMNIGNALDAPRDIPWDVEMDIRYFDAIQSAGFDCVRLPVRFSDYVKDSSPYALDESFMQEIDTYVDYALELGLVLILDFHHFVEMMDDPERFKPQFLSIWRQLSERYQDYPKELVFELLNEPTNQLEGELWNEYLSEAIALIRLTNKDRLLIVGPDHYYSLDRLEVLKIPQDDNLLVSFHFYEPNNFTFQGNPYHVGFEHLSDIAWTGDEQECNELEQRFEKARRWAEAHHVRLFLGEFGANQRAPRDSRILWTRAIRELAEEKGFSWGYWELASGFGIFDPVTFEWDQDLLHALLDNEL